MSVRELSQVATMASPFRAASDQRGYSVLHDYLIESAHRLPDKIALVCQGQRLTYATLDQLSNALAQALVKRGVERGDRVIVFEDNTIETVIAF